MMMIYTIHNTETDKLAAVKAEMQRFGAPTIRVVDCADHYFALEGSHRIAAAHELGIEPELIVYGQYDEIDISDFDWYQNDPELWNQTTYLAGEVAGELFSVRTCDYRFE